MKLACSRIIHLCCDPFLEHVKQMIHEKNIAEIAFDKKELMLTFINTKHDSSSLPLPCFLNNELTADLGVVYDGNLTFLSLRFEDWTLTSPL